MSSNVLHSSSLLLKVIWSCSTSLLHYMVSIIWFLNHHMVPLYGFSIIIWFPLYGFSIIIWFPLYGFSIIIWFHYMVSQSSYGFHYMVSQSSYGSIIWFLNNRMVPLYGFSIIIWYPKIWFLNQNLVNYMFPNQTSAFSIYSATDSSKCASTTDSSCFRVQCKVKRGERWYHLFGLTQNGYLSNHKVVC